MMGPGPPKRKGDKGGSKNASTRALNTAGQGSSDAGSGAPSTDASSPTAMEGSRTSGEGWNRTRYQREDEALWGPDMFGPGQRIRDAIARAGSTAGRLLEGRLSKSGPSMEEEQNPKSYYLGKNPPVNDLHPPVVSTQPASRDETRWMLQPPPSAKVMEGKERVNRSRADSGGSSRKGGDGTPLGRQVTERLMDANLQRGETSSFPDLRTQSSRPTLKPKGPNSTKLRGHRHDREGKSSSDSSGTVMKKKKRKPPPIAISPSAMSSRDSIEHLPLPAEKARRDLPARPTLATIPSSGNAVLQLRADDLALRELSAPSSTLNSRTPSPTNRLSSNAKSMPASITSVDTRFLLPAILSFPSRKLWKTRNRLITIKPPHKVAR